MELRNSDSRFKLKRRYREFSAVQLIGGLILCLLFPYVAFMEKIENSYSIANLFNVAIMCSFSIVFGHYFFRKLVVFPGARSSAYIVPVFSVSYGSGLVIFFISRLPYSSMFFLSSFLSCLVYYYMCYFVERRVRPRRLAIIPCPAAHRLTRLAGVEWTVLHEQGEAMTLDALVADFRMELSRDWERFIAEQAISGIPVYHIKQIEEAMTGMVDIEHLSENNFGSLIPGMAYIKIKQTVEWIAAFLALILLLPVFLIVALAIKIDSHGPVLFRQARMGYRGRPFVVFKFRSMVTAEAASSNERDHAMTRDNDARITRIGRYIRRSRIDELPQILNVLRGEMSLIGPRPEATVLSNWYEMEIPFYRYRHIVRPGISGWAQVNQGHVTDMIDVHTKLKYDFYYIKYFSPWLDILIIARTIRTIVSGFGVR
jgi:lipopolysaccharide/colanic/teichoic acid biosynthesis glycosyltransferase